MKNNNKKDFYTNLALLIASPVLIVAGVLTVLLTQNYIGWALILLGIYFFLMWGIRALAMRSVKKEQNKKELAIKKENEKLFDDALKAFQNKTDYPAPNTVRLVKEDIEFFAEGRYVCEKDFKNIHGYHFAFEIDCPDLKYMPEGYDDVCDLEGCGVLVAVGYNDGEALEEYANDNGIVLKDTLGNSVGQSITLKRDKGYSFYVRTAEFDDAEFGFVKILKCEGDVVTIYFILNVPYGLCDMVEGTVELKREPDKNARDIQSLISKIKRKPFNTISVSDEEIEEIKAANPFLPESYITFLREVGFTDMKWITVGWSAKTPNNIDDYDSEQINGILANNEGLNADDYYFIGYDNSDDLYAFSKNPDDNKVYCFSGDAAGITTDESFEEFLYNILNV